MNAQDNVHIVREVFAAWNSHDVEGFVKRLDTKTVWESDVFPAPFNGHEGARRFFKLYVAAFPDLRLDIELLEGDAEALPFPDASFDAVVCAVSVQYLVRPWDVFADVRRIVRAGGPLVVSFSDRCFPTKAVAIWLLGGDEEHVMLVRSYLEAAGYPEIHTEAPHSPDDPLFVVWGR